ncbi:ferredoxin reductase family protein [Marinomonas sp. A79]|uniref:Ferredoxin reductase family protein n=1 Tax=Marinomonas vulgaris TaxID=2823372 RepID=A0ABS5H8L5_9GAMM|nr:ferredoxin reductase family protein [Marinomonas vulgaris]MBR7887782.1 ferredoxin reductase family protein [Marinomonas vulgaris]
MTTRTSLVAKPKQRRSLYLGERGKLLLGYTAIMLIPFLATYALDMQLKTTYAFALSAMNTLAMMMFYLQFPLGSRLKKIAWFANIDWNMTHHKKVGQWLGLIFFLHPILILAPRFSMSWGDGITSVITTVTASNMLIGVIAWVSMVVWILLSIFKQRLPIRYETWRLTHMMGFVTIIVLATVHITNIGQHGQYAPWFNVIWWGLCSFSVMMVLFNYFVKPILLKRQPFELTEVTQVSSRDWQVTLKTNNDAFDFEPGQFVWFNTTAPGGLKNAAKEHPFSIASSRSSLPNLSFLIRNLGDYTSQLGTLKIGQNVYVDGPYGSMSLHDSAKAKAILLIAGGAGIGPMLSLLRGLADQNDTRPIRLIYGNNQLDQMVLQEDILQLETTMANFKQQLVSLDKGKNAYQGVIDQTIISRLIEPHPTADWSVYLCGPQPMVEGVQGSLKKLSIANRHIHFEHLSF